MDRFKGGELVKFIDRDVCCDTGIVIGKHSEHPTKYIVKWFNDSESVENELDLKLTKLQLDEIDEIYKEVV